MFEIGEVIEFIDGEGKQLLGTIVEIKNNYFIIKIGIMESDKNRYERTYEVDNKKVMKFKKTNLTSM